MKERLRAIRRQTVAALTSLAIVLSPVLAAQELTVNFRDTDLREVISFVSDVTGRTIVVDPLVNGRVMVMSEEPLNPSELYELFLSVLDVHNFVAIETGNVVRIIPKAQTRTSAIGVSSHETTQMSSAALVTQVIPVRNVSATQLLPVLRPMVPPESHLAAYEPSNSIVITDTAMNAARIRDLINAFDESAVDSSDVIELEHASASVIAELVTETLIGNSQNSGLKIPTITADIRTNRILITGDTMSRQRVATLVEQLDTPAMALNNGRVIYLNYANAEDVAFSLAGIAASEGGENGGAKIEFDAQTNSLILTGDPTQVTIIADIAKQLDVERVQVLVEAIIVEIQDTEGKELGVQWLFADSEAGGYGGSVTPNAAANMGGVTGSVLSVDENGDVGRDLVQLGGALSAVNGQTLGFSGINGTLNFNVLLNLLQEEEGANILSTPSVLTTDNREAEINVGQNVPFVTGSYTSQGNSTNPSSPFQTIDREDVGIKLKVTPRVNRGDNRIVLDIEQEVSSLSGNTGVNASDIITNERKINTQVVATNGGLVVLGGLIQDDLQEYEQKVPFLGDIPLLGALFRSSGNRLVKTNLLVFIRATVLDSEEALEAESQQRYDYIQGQQSLREPPNPQYIDGAQQPDIESREAMDGES